MGSFLWTKCEFHSFPIIKNKTKQKLSCDSPSRKSLAKNTWSPSPTQKWELTLAVNPTRQAPQHWPTEETRPPAGGSCNWCLQVKHSGWASQGAHISVQSIFTPLTAEISPDWSSAGSLGRKKVAILKQRKLLCWGAHQNKSGASFFSRVCHLYAGVRDEHMIRSRKEVKTEDILVWALPKALHHLPLGSRNQGAPSQYCQ